MGLFSRLSTELRSAGKAARGAIDEGRIRLEIFRVRQLADKAAQALGYAVHRARREGKEPDADILQRLGATLDEHEATARRLEEDLARATTVPPAQPTEPGEPAVPAAPAP
jgi:hypothetical protein